MGGFLASFEIGRYTQYNHPDNRKEYKKLAVFRTCFKCCRKKQCTGADHAQTEPKLMRQGIVGVTDRVRNFLHLLYHCKDIAGNENERY
nr:MAG TPA: hypothetical protein [Bacteriophage sp.]